jgi:RNA polymerase sigma-70 factor (sigma-E family)
MDAGEVVADLLSTSGDRLLRLAYQLSHDHATAEDLVQQALEQLYRSWTRRPVHIDNPEGYARTAIVNEYMRRKRLRSAGDIVTPLTPEHADPAATDVAIVEHDAMWRSLGLLSARQRAALVLRYYEDLADRDIATLLGCREATVRSLVARGLDQLRRAAPAGALGTAGGAHD